jgi:peptidoglycan glycosyltransferase
VNQPIIRLFGLVVVMFALLVGFTSRWTIFDAASLRNNPLNARALLQQQRIERGPIVAADGTVLARSVRTRGSHGAEVRARGRLLLHRPRADGARELPQPRPER